MIEDDVMELARIIYETLESGSFDALNQGEKNIYVQMAAAAIDGILAMGYRKIG